MLPVHFLLLVVAAICLGGCASVSEPTAEEDPVQFLRIGMPAEVIVAKFGKPVAVVPATNADGQPVEFWEYRFSVSRRVSMAATGTTDAPAFDPLLGNDYGLKIVQEMTYKPKAETVVKVVALQIYDGHLASMRIGYEREDKFE